MTASFVPNPLLWGGVLAGQGPERHAPAARRQGASTARSGVRHPPTPSAVFTRCIWCLGGDIEGWGFASLTPAAEFGHDSTRP